MFSDRISELMTKGSTPRSKPTLRIHIVLVCFFSSAMGDVASEE